MEKIISYEHKGAGGEILNKAGHHSTASLSYRVDARVSVNIDEATVTEGKDGEEPKIEPARVHYVSTNVDADVQITDCSRCINLDFDCEDEEKAANSLYKIDTLISNLVNFRQELIKGIALIHQTKVFREEYKNRKKVKDEITEEEGLRLLGLIK